MMTSYANPFDIPEGEDWTGFTGSEGWNEPPNDYYEPSVQPNAANIFLAPLEEREASFKEWLKGRDFNQELAKKSKSKAPTYTATQYKIYADNLFDAFVGPGTDETRVRAVFSAMKSDTDVLELIKGYGTRDGGAYWYSPKMTLVEQVPYDLTDSEIATYVNAPLIANGVSYRF